MNEHPHLDRLDRTLAGAVGRCSLFCGDVRCPEACVERDDPTLPTEPMPSVRELRGERAPERPDPERVHHAIMMTLAVIVALLGVAALTAAVALS